MDKTEAVNVIQSQMRKCIRRLKDIEDKGISAIQLVLTSPCDDNSYGIIFNKGLIENFDYLKSRIKYKKYSEIKDRTTNKKYYILKIEEFIEDFSTIYFTGFITHHGHHHSDDYEYNLVQLKNIYQGMLYFGINKTTCSNVFCEFKIYIQKYIEKYIQDTEIRILILIYEILKDELKLTIEQENDKIYNRHTYTSRRYIFFMSVIKLSVDYFIEHNQFLLEDYFLEKEFILFKEPMSRYIR